MRSFGVGKTLMADKITREAEKLCGWLDDSVGTTNLYLPLRFSIGNIVSSLVFGQSYELGDPRFEEIIQSLDDLFDLLGSTEYGFLADYPWLSYVLPGGLKAKELTQVNAEIEKFLTVEFERIGQTLDKEGEPTNVAEAYMIELHKREKSGNIGHFSVVQMFAATGA